MSLAPFFDRARQSASQVLRDCDTTAFDRRLSEVCVTLAFDSEAEASKEARCSLDMAVRLAARLYPRIGITPVHGSCSLADELIALARAINPNIEVVDEENATPHVAFVVGTSTFKADTVVHVGSDGWIATVSTERPLASGCSGNPFGAGAAACIGMANVFRSVFAEWIERPELDRDARMSLLNFETGVGAANAGFAPRNDIGLLQLVGAGAIGNAFLWAVARAEGLVGRLHVIDHELIELSNLQRYVLAAMKDDQRSKVDLAAAAMAASLVTVDQFMTTWAEYVDGMGHHHFERVAVALDTARDRVQVQSSLPRQIFNGWTQSGDLGISRHVFDGDHACLACLYLPAGKRRNEDQIVAEELKLLGQPNVERVRTMLHLGQPVGEAFVREIALTTGAAVEDLLPFAALPLRAFRQRAICGNVIMKARDGEGADVHVPVAFQSAFAGVMLAAEVVASSPGVRSAEITTRTVIDLMRVLPGLVTTPVRKGALGGARCICCDPDWQKAYQTKYSGAGATG